MAYWLQLPARLGGMHDVFHVSRLKKYYPDPQHVLATEKINLQENLSYREEPVEIIDRKIKVLKTKEMPLVKVLWRYHDVREPTWETKEWMQ